MSRVCRRLSPVLAALLAAGACAAQAPEETREPTASFGVTVVVPFGFCGRIYKMRTGRDVPGCSSRLPEFQKLRSIGTIYTTELDVSPREFHQGFPGVTKRYEWFAIDYKARFWVETPGEYEFTLLSDDGSALYLDERQVINNDCIHPIKEVSGTVQLEGGIHEIRVSYFQGPRFHVALVLKVKPPGGDWRIFDTGDFKPPPNPAEWKYPNPGNLDLPADPCRTGPAQEKLTRRP